MKTRTAQLSTSIIVTIFLLATAIGSAFAKPAPVTLPSAYYLPFGPDAGPIRVSRTGYLYKADYSLAGLTRYNDSDFHPTLGNLPKEKRGAIDFAGGNWFVRAAADGKVIKSDQCQVVVQTGNDTAYYIHHSHKIMVNAGKVVKRGDVLAVTGGYADCGADGAHLHFAVWRNGVEVPVYFQDVPAQTSNGSKCLAGLVCPSHTGYVEFRYNGSIQYVFNNGTSSLTQDQNWGRANLTGCANNLPGYTVNVLFSRIGKNWTYSQKATTYCVTFWDMDGAGLLNRATIYYSRAALNQAPSASWPIPCAGVTGGQGLCDALKVP